MEEKRRKTERIFFKQMLGIYCVTGAGEGDKARQLDIVDISEDACSFQVPFDPKDPWPSTLQEIPLRVYFSQDTYLPVHLKIQNSRPCIEEGQRYVRYGCSIDKSVTSYETFQQFVRFLKSYSVHAHKDTGKVTLFYL
jgi:hypothetical protein